MTTKSQTVELRGTISFAKILGDPVLSYDKSYKEWTLDVVINEDTAKELKGYGIADKVKRKENYLEGSPFLTFKQKEFRADGTTANKPIEVVDIFGKPWDQDKKIGNGSVVDIRFRVVDYGPGKKKGMYPAKIRVLDLVPYEGEGFTKLNEEDEYFRKAVAQQEEEVKEFRKDFDLDDGVDDIGDDAI